MNAMVPVGPVPVPMYGAPYSHASNVEITQLDLQCHRVHAKVDIRVDDATFDVAFA